MSIEEAKTEVSNIVSAAHNFNALVNTARSRGIEFVWGPKKGNIIITKANYIINLLEAK